MHLRPNRLRSSVLLLSLTAAALGLSGCAQFDHVSTMVTPSAAPTPKTSPTDTTSPTPTPAATPLPTQAPVVDSWVIDVHTLSVGDCFNELDPLGTNEVIGEVAFVDCSEPHEYEVYWQAELPSGLTLEELDAEGDRICYEAFEPFAGAPWEASDYYFSYFMPSEESALANEDMTVDCIIFHEYDLIEGSLRDVGYADWAERPSDA